MTDTVKLRQAIEKSGFKIRFIANKCGLTYQGFLNKVNNHTAFNAPEILSLRKLLGLSPEESEEIFFTKCVDE